MLVLAARRRRRKSLWIVEWLHISANSAFDSFYVLKHLGGFTRFDLFLLNEKRMHMEGTDGRMKGLGRMEMDLG